MTMKYTVAAAALAVSFAGSAAAQQQGLVNVSVDNNNVQVPIGLAAQVCGVSAAVIAQDFAQTTKPVCEIDQQTAAQHNIGQSGGQGQGQGRATAPGQQNRQ